MKVAISTGAVKTLSLAEYLPSFVAAGCRLINLNLTPLYHGIVPISDISEQLSVHGMSISVLEGGWCDFFEGNHLGADTLASVDKQVEYARALNVNHLRLFFGVRENRLPDTRMADQFILRLVALADRYKDIVFLFENHGGLSNNVQFLIDTLNLVNKNNIKLNFDSVNFEVEGIDPIKALEKLAPHVASFHVKGRRGYEYDIFGNDDSKIPEVTSTVLSLKKEILCAVEYEGKSDRLPGLITSYINYKNYLVS